MDIKKQATEYVNKKYGLFTDKLKQILVDVYIVAFKAGAGITTQKRKDDKAN